MKKKLLLLASVVICIATVTSGTLAYFTAEDEARNVITSDAVDIEIEEWQKSGNELVPYPKDKPIEVMPSSTVSKIVKIKNNEAESFIRAKYEVIIKDHDDNKMDLDSETLAKIVSVAVNEDEWQRKDGDSEWWYCADSVNERTATEPFFTEVVFDGPNMTNEYQNCTVEIIVKAQAVQTANNGDSAIEAAGWSEE